MTVEEQLERDLRALATVEAGAGPQFRTWSAERPTVVVGRSVRVDQEVDEAFCAARAIPIVRRPSGGGAVLVGPGTLQYAFALPLAMDAELASIASSKRFCNRILLDALPRAEGLRADVSGDLVVGDRKIGGLALKRRRLAMLLHGTILMDADLALVGKALRHPLREPAYRKRRQHGDFLANLGPLDSRRLEADVRALLARLG